MSKVYFSYFKSYCGRLDKSQQTQAQELMGSMDTANEGFKLFHVTGSASGANKSSGFSMGKRDEILQQDQLHGPILVPHAIAGTKLPFEVLFRY